MSGFFSSFLPRHLRRGRAISFERRLSRLETIMSETKSELLDEIKQIKAAVEANLSNQQTAIDAAVTKAKAAWDADNQDEHEAAMAALEEIRTALTPAAVTAPASPAAADPAAPSA